MAKAKAICTCSICGEQFVKTKDCYNRKDANDWEEYAVNNYTTCPSCYGKKKREAEVSKGLYIDVAFDTMRSAHDHEDYVAIVFGGDTMPHKDAIKSLGAIWTDQFPAGGFLGGILGHKNYGNRWTIWCTMEEADEKIKLAQGIGATIGTMPSDTDFEMLKQFILDNRARKAKKQEGMQAELDALGEKPQWREDIQAIWNKGGSWNGKIYGRTGSYNLYLSGEKIQLTDEQKESIEATQEARSAWSAAKKEIEKKHK